MKSVLIVGHGSRQKSTEQTLESVVEMTRRSLPGTLIEIAYMEFGEQDIPSGLLALTGCGADEIAVVPYFLFDGIHIREDIPEALEAFKAEHKNIKITMGRPFGADERLASILLDRVMEVI
jgi:sirohydrochlorin ferrochelatase